MNVSLNGEKARKIREGQLKTIEDAMEFIGKKMNTIYRIEGGKTTNIKTAKKYAEFLGVSIEELETKAA